MEDFFTRYLLEPIYIFIFEASRPYVIPAFFYAIYVGWVYFVGHYMRKTFEWRGRSWIALLILLPFSVSFLDATPEDFGVASGGMFIAALVAWLIASSRFCNAFGRLGRMFAFACIFGAVSALLPVPRVVIYDTFVAQQSMEPVHFRHRTADGREVTVAIPRAYLVDRKLRLGGVEGRPGKIEILAELSSMQPIAFAVAKPPELEILKVSLIADPRADRSRGAVFSGGIKKILKVTAWSVGLDFEGKKMPTNIEWQNINDSFWRYSFLDQGVSEGAFNTPDQYSIQRHYYVQDRERPQAILACDTTECRRFPTALTDVVFEYWLPDSKVKDWPQIEAKVSALINSFIVHPAAVK